MKLYVNTILFLAALIVSGCGYGMPAIGQPQNAYSPYLSSPQTFRQNPYLGDPGLVQGGYGGQFAAETSNNAYDSYGNNSYGSNEGYGYSSLSDAGGYLPETEYPVLEQELSDSVSQTPSETLAPDLAPDPIPASAFSVVSDDLNILTLNVWGLPGPLVEDRKERFERLGAQLNAYDIVTLQETFSDDIEILKQTTGFAYHSRHNNSSFYRLGSGLYTLSKYPIIKTDSMTFGRCTVADCLARKGVYMTRIDHPKIGPIDVYTTHYQAEDKPTSEKIRIEEDNAVLQEIMARNHSEYPVIVTGDFNFLPDQLEYKDLLAKLPLIDTFRAFNPNEAGYTSHPDNPYKTDKSPERLDYIFYLPKTGIQYDILDVSVTLNSPVDGYTLSDHYGVKAHFRIQTQIAQR